MLEASVIVLSSLSKSSSIKARVLAYPTSAAFCCRGGSLNPVASRLTLHVFDDSIQEVILLVHPHDEIACRTPSGGGHPLASCRRYCRWSSPKGKHSSGVLRKQHLVYTQEQWPFSRYRSPVRWVLFGLIGEWLQRISRHHNRSEMVPNQGLGMPISKPDQPLSSGPL